MRVVITGGSGYIGRAVGAALRARGHEVVAAHRGPVGDPGSDWDPASGWVRPGAFEGFDAVVALGGVSIGAARWTASRRALLRASRVDALRRLSQHLAGLARPPRVLVSASAVGYYGNRAEPRLDETATGGTGFLAGLVADWEAATAAASGAGVRVVHARLGPVVARDSELMRRLLLPFRLGLGGPIGSGQQWFSWVSAEDAARAIVFAIEHESLAGAVNVTAPEPVTNAAFTRALGRALHRPAVMPLPAMALRLMFGRALADEVLLGGQSAVPAKLLAAGFVFEHPTIEAALAAHLGGRTAGGPAAAPGHGR